MVSDRLIKALDKIIEKCGGPGSGVPGPCPIKSNKIIVSKSDAAAIRKVFGVSPEDISKVAGAIDGSTVRLYVNKSGKEIHVSVEIEHHDYVAERRVYNDGTIFNDLIRMNYKTGGGVGTSIFKRQVDAASSLGWKKIRAFAEGGTNSGLPGVYNGYYTWPRLGYDAQIPKHLLKLAVKIVPNAKTISDLMKSYDGREWWKNNGEGVEVSFDLTKGSLSRKVLDAYVKERASRTATGSGSKGRGNS